MNFKACILSLALMVSAFSLNLWAQSGPTVRTHLAADTIMIGDQIALEVDISKDISDEVRVPQFENNKLTDKIEIVGVPRIDTLSRDGRAMTLRLSYMITSFDAGVHQMAGFPIVYDNKGKSDTIVSADMIQLVVQTFDIDTTKQSIADIKSQLNTPLQWAEVKEVVLYSAVGVVLLAVLIYFVIRFVKSRRRKIAARPSEPPHITAIRELERLHSEKLPQAGKYKEYYSRITDTLRLYIEHRYGIGAMEMTTPEILEAVKNINEPKLTAKLNELFSLADLVKFAKWTPTIDESEEAFQTAYHYVEETKIMIVNPTVEQDA